MKKKYTGAELLIKSLIQENVKVTIEEQRSRTVKEAEEVSRTLKAEYETVTSEQEDFVEAQARENESEKEALEELTSSGSRRRQCCDY